MKLDTGDTLFIWGNNAQIYKLSETIPAGRFSVAYHIHNDERLKETALAIDQTKPRFIIVLPDSEKKDLPLTNYAYLLTIEGAAIYERKN
jgi:hypothetical protein